MPCDRCGHEFDTTLEDGEAHLREVLDHYEARHDPSWVTDPTT